MTDLPALLQLADAGFPAGAFSHSFGLETAIAEERVRDEATLAAWLRAYLHGTFAPMDGAAFVLVARDGADPLAADDRLATAQPNAEIRRANAHLARATLASFDAMGLRSAALQAYAAAVDEGRCDGQHVLAAALGYGAGGVAWRLAVTAHAAATTATLASVAARTVPLGQRAIARTRWNLRGAIETATARSEQVRSLDELATASPATEIDGLRHRRLDGRLFAS